MSKRAFESFNHQNVRPTTLEEVGATSIPSTMDQSFNWIKRVVARKTDQKA